MASLIQALRRTADAGEPIKSPLQGLERLGATIRRGQLTLIAAGPGGLKTLLTHAMVHHGDKTGKNSVLYFSADTGPDVIYKRAAALATGYEQSEVERMEEAKASEAIQAKVLRESSHIDFDFTTSPTPSYIERRLDAYVELHGAYPEVIVVDVLKDLSDPEDADEFRALEDATQFLRNLAFETGAACIALHHVGGEFENGSAKIPLSGVRGKITKTASLILTLHRPEEQYLHVSVVKNRNGAADASGGRMARLRVDPGRMRIEE
ncbi:DnaB-like helicase C-terminal domain-containing protein [Nesterenkonia sp. CL21]|uniref:DnaB-like helicase C-terminal domain-containing protein n=1 Tax=Nesterenkonia sp. CL21 TaxID=3064894 RepID=UPI0028796524|nr:DnaB-like helicase C-terminal domain-containing protein [Nesterenkonia sp. CL21]MDS2171587.1 DnaB-like helicase C-terminal domain-containing protein [Nesterenkonia sp. CL21]